MSVPHAVVMAGGSGTRFWPKSRRLRPKQLLKLHGDATMLQQTIRRVEPLTAPDRTWIVTGAEQADAVRAQAAEVGVPAERVVAEPCPRDTAACVGLSAVLARSRDPDAVMVVMPSDHVIQPDEQFRETVRAAFDLVARDPAAFVTFGIPPTRPETGYGYIERGEPLDGARGVPAHRVARFREKPDRDTARRYLDTGRFFWNAGIFVWRADAILAAIARFQPALGEGLERIAAAVGTPNFEAELAAIFPELPRIPIDRAVMEHADNVVVLEARYHWSDVGDWRALAVLEPPDADGNSIQGAVLARDTRDCVIVADEGRLIATLGVRDLVVIQAGGATLVAHKGELDQLKALVESLDEAGYGHLL